MARRNRNASKVERLERRQHLTVTVVTAPANVTVKAGVTGATYSFRNAFKTDGPSGTIVDFDTVSNGVHAPVQALLYNSVAPSVVTNFLAYVRAGSYSDTFADDARNFSGVNGADVTSSPANYLQFGRFRVDETSNVVSTVPGGPTTRLVYNPSYSNQRGTLALIPDAGQTRGSSAFLFNLADNSAHFTNTSNYQVFGTVISGLSSLGGTAVSSQPSKGQGGTSSGGGYASLPRVSVAVPVSPYTLPSVPVTTAAAGFSAANAVRIVSATVDSTTTLIYTVAVSDSRVVTTSTIDSHGLLTLGYGSTTGASTVTVTATDLAGASATNSFTVTNPAVAIDVRVNGVRVADQQSLPGALGTAFPGQALSATVTIRNQGPGLLVLSPITVPAGFTLAGQATTTSSTGMTTIIGTNLAAGRTLTLTLAVDTSHTGSHAGALLIPNNSTNGNGQLTLPISATVGNTVILGAGGGKSVSYIDGDGTPATLTFRGTGTESVTFSGGSLAASTRAGVTSITGTSVGVAAIALDSTDLTSSATATTRRGGDGLITLATLATGKPVNQINFAPVLLSGASTIARDVRTLTLAGLTHATVTLSGNTGTLAVRGAVTDSQITAVGAYDGTNPSTGSISHFSAKSFVRSNLLVGVATTGVPTGPGSFTPKVKLGSFTVDRHVTDAFAGSVIEAGTVGSLQLGLLTASGAGSQVFLETADSISLTYGKPFSTRRIVPGQMPRDVLVAAGVPSSRLSISAV